MTCVTLAAAPGLLRLTLRIDGQALVPASSPVRQRDAEIREHFGIRDPVIVLVKTTHPEKIFNTDTLRTVDRLTARLAELDGIGHEHVISLATERRDRVFPGEGQSFRPFLDPVPTTSRQMADFREDLNKLSARILTGTLVSSDRSSTAIVIGIPAPSTSAGRDFDRPRFYRQVLSITEPYQTSTDRILVVGAPFAESLLGRHLIADLSVLLPLTAAITVTILWLGCRRIWGVVLGVAEILACVVWTFGLMGYLGVPVYLTTAVLPVILITVGLADEVHIFWHYQDCLEETTDVRSAVLRTMRNMIRPVVITSATTAIGFASFASSPVPAIRSFGIFASVGIVFCLAWSLTAIPASLALIRRTRMQRPMGWTARRDRALQLFTPLLSRPKLTLALLLILTVGLGLGLANLRVQDGWICGFAPRSQFRQATDQVNASLNGTHVLLAHLEFDSPDDKVPEAWDRSGPLLDPEKVQAIGLFEDFLRRQPEVGGVLGLHSHLGAMAHFWQFPAQANGDRLPVDVDGVSRLVKRFDLGRGSLRRREVVDDDLRRTVVTIFLKDANYRDTNRILTAARNYANSALSSMGAKLHWAGDVAISQAMIPSIVRTQLSSLSLALGLAFLVLLTSLRSIRAALLAVLPSVIAVVWLLGAMGWSGIPLGVATSMFSAITLSIGVDYAIHFIESARRSGGLGSRLAVRHALGDAGPAIVTDALAVSLGFLALTVSQVQANARLGLIVALGIGTCCVLTLLGLGSLVSLAAIRRADR